MTGIGLEDFVNTIIGNVIYFKLAYPTGLAKLKVRPAFQNTNKFKFSDFIFVGSNNRKTEERITPDDAIKIFSAKGNAHRYTLPSIPIYLDEVNFSCKYPQYIKDVYKPMIHANSRASVAKFEIIL